MAYDALEVSDGQVAASLLERLLCRPGDLSADACKSLRTQLEAYCTHDTAVMVELFQFLNEAGRATIPEGLPASRAGLCVHRQGDRARRER